jgi:hypothetical protein
MGFSLPMAPFTRTAAGLVVGTEHVVGTGLAVVLGLWSAKCWKRKVQGMTIFKASFCSRLSS